jgi:competence protein ComEC
VSAPDGPPPGGPGGPPPGPAAPGRPPPGPAHRLDLRLLPAAAGAWAAAWTALVARPGPTAAVAASAALAGVVVLVRVLCRPARPGRPSIAAVAAAALLCTAAGGLAAATRVAAAGAGPVPALSREEAAGTFDLVVTADPCLLPDRVRGAGPARSLVLLRVRAERVVARGRTTAVRSPLVVFADDPAWLDLIPGRRVRVTGRLGPARPHDRVAAILRVHGPPVGAAPAGRLQRAADRVRDGLRTAVSGLPADERGLVPGLVLGDTSGLGEDLASDFRVAGLSHLTAVSGANLALLLGLVLAGARRAGLGLRAVPVLGGVTMAGFLLLARPEPSLLRATVMGAVGVLGLSSGRRGRGAPALCAAVVLLVLLDPWLARSYGFALSVLATVGLLVLAPPWRDRLARRMPGPLATALAVPVAAQAACGPVIVLLAGGVSLVAIPANLLAAPAVGPATVLGVGAALTSTFAPGLARVLGELAGLPAWWIAAVARRAAALPGATLPWPGGLRGALALAAATAALALWWRRRARAASGTPGPAGRPSVALRLAVLAVGVCVLLRPPLPVFPGRLPGAWPPPGWLVVACDVGQGDALVLAAGGGAAVVVDAGPDPGAVDRCLRRLGVRRVPYLLLTHFHADHVEGLPGVLRGRRVAEIGVSPLPDPPGEVGRVRVWARAAGVPVTAAAPGDVRVAGGLRWRVLWPRRFIAEGSAPNNASVVLLAETRGVRILLTGDIEPPAQAALLRAEPGLHADVLKVPHHGSLYQDPDLARTVHARVALTSVGAGNDYGHPAPHTMELVRAAGMRSLRTDLDGDIAVSGGVGSLRATGRAGAGEPPLAHPVASEGSAPIAAGPSDARRRGRRFSPSGSPA